MNGQAAKRDSAATSGRAFTRWSLTARVSRLGLAPRLFLNSLLIVVAGAVTVFAAAVFFGPPLFHHHLQEANLPQIDAGVRDHVDNAFGQALLIALSIGVIVAGLVAAAISWLIARRVAVPVQQTASALQRLADGHPDVQVDDPGLGPELATLADAANRLARRLHVTDEHRRALTADLAHQLRTPIASLQATVQAIQDGILTVDDETLGVLSAQSTHLQRLVADLEKVSRAEERRIVLSSSPQALAPVIERVVASQRERYAAAGVSVHLVAPPPPGPTARVDPDRIHEAVENLLDNALAHTPRGGSVTVTTRAGRDGRTCEIEVADTGSGFDPARAELLFRRFHRESRSSSGGSGLGLTIARALVEAHGGTLRAKSEGVGTGASFTISLPSVETRSSTV